MNALCAECSEYKKKDAINRYYLEYIWKEQNVW